MVQVSIATISSAIDMINYNSSYVLIKIKSRRLFGCRVSILYCQEGSCPCSTGAFFILASLRCRLKAVSEKFLLLILRKRE